MTKSAGRTNSTTTAYRSGETKSHATLNEIFYAVAREVLRMHAEGSEYRVAAGDTLIVIPRGVAKYPIHIAMADGTTATLDKEPSS